MHEGPGGKDKKKGLCMLLVPCVALDVPCRIFKLLLLVCFALEHCVVFEWRGCDSVSEIPSKICAH